MRANLLALACLAAAPADADTLIVGNKVADTLSFIDLETGREIAERPTGRAPHEIAVSPDGRTAIVVSYRAQGYVGDAMHVFDVAAAKKTGVVDLHPHRAPHGLKWIPGGSTVIATTEASRDVVFVDVAARELTGAVATDQDGTHMVALSPDGATAYAANIASGSFTVIDVTARRKRRDVKAGEGTEAIAVTPDGAEIWVGNNGSRSVMAFDAATFERKRTIKTKGVPIRVEISPDGAVAAVSEFDANRVIALSTETGETIADVDLAAVDAAVPVTLLFSPQGDRLWAAATGSAKIVEIATDDWSIVRTLPAGEGSDGLGYSPVDLTVPE